MLAGGWLLTHAAGTPTPALDLLVTLALLPFPVVGALIAARRPQNVIGWLFVAAAALFAASSLAEGYADYADSRAAPGGIWAAWASTWLFKPAVFGTPPLLFLLFPSGRP